MHGRPFWQEDWKVQALTILILPLALPIGLTAYSLVSAFRLPDASSITDAFKLSLILPILPYAVHLIARPKPIEPPPGYIPSHFHDLPAEPIPGVDHPENT